MRIAFVDNLPEGGAKRVLFEQMKWFSKRHEVAWFTNTQASTFPFEEIVTTIHRYPLNVNVGHGFHRLWLEFRQLRQMFELYSKMKREIILFKADAVVVHPDQITQSPMILSFLTTPTLYYMEEWLRLVYEPELHPIPEVGFLKKGFEKTRRRVYRQVDLWNTRSATLLAANSEFTAQNITRVYGKEARVIYPGVDTEVFKPKKSPSRNYFLFVGSPNFQNGYGLLKQAAEQAPMKLQLKFVPFKDKFAVSDLEMVKLYQNAVATLCLGINEPFGLAAVESMACKTPVIALDQGGYRETVEEGMTGLRIEPTSDALLGAMIALAKDTELHRKLAANGRERVKKDFSWENHGERLEKMIIGLKK